MSDVIKGYDITYVNGNDLNAVVKFSGALFDKVYSDIHNFKEIVILCIGSDRATGDCLGPIIGHNLTGHDMEGIQIYGNLEKPVHAKNLQNTIEEIYTANTNPFVIAIDACLGKYDHIGYLTIGNCPVKPGAGVKKQLPPIGDISITGIVNFGGFMDEEVIQSTRLGLVMKMADIITRGIVNVFKSL